MTRILLTGANGHIGANIARSLLIQGYDVVPFVRATSDLRGLAPLNLTPAYGDVLDRDSIMAAGQDCDVIIHTAAVYRYWSKNPDEIIAPALTGTRNILHAARELGLKRLIYTSTLWTVGFSDDQNTLLTAKDWNEDARNPYAWAKTRAEQEAWQLAEAYGVPMLSICPAGVLGPYDYRLTPSMRLFRDWVNGTQFTAEAGFALVDVRDVAAIHTLAIKEGEPGERYIVSGKNLTTRELGQLIGKLTGYAPPHVPVGRRVATLYGALGELLAKVTGSPPNLTRATARETIGHYMFTDCSATWRTFDYQPRPAELMVRDAIRWLLYIGEIKDGRAAAFGHKFPPDPSWPEP